MGKIKYKNPKGDAYDSPKIPLTMMLMDEAGQWALPDPNFNWKDAMKKLKTKGTELRFAKPKNKSA
jgi:hypothetical protein